MLLEDELADSRNDSEPPLKTLPLEREVELRFLHFQLLEFWGKGGGLQYFSVQEGELGFIPSSDQLVFSRFSRNRKILLGLRLSKFGL